MQTYPEKFREKDPKKIDKILKRGALSKLVTKANYLLAIQEHLFSCLSHPEMAQHCKVINLDGQTLAIEVNQAAIATRLRYEQQSLIGRLNVALPRHNIRHLRIKIKP